MEKGPQHRENLMKCTWAECTAEFPTENQLEQHLNQEHIDGRKASIEMNDGEKKIHLATEYFVDILIWISRMQLAKGVSLTCRLFNNISRPRLDVEHARVVPTLEFVHSDSNYRELILKKMDCKKYPVIPIVIPIATVPSPANILNFDCINIRFLHLDVLTFMRVIRPKLDARKIHLSIYEIPKNNAKSREDFHQLLSFLTDTLLKFYEMSSYRNYIHYSILDKVEMVRFFGKFRVLYPAQLQFVRSVQYLRIHQTSNDIIEWLHTRMDNEQPRLVFAHYDKIGQLTEECKKLFLESRNPVSFIFHFDTLNEEPESFNVKNEQTDEQLILGWHYHGDESYFLLRRFPNGDDLSWRQLIEKESNYHDVGAEKTLINIYIQKSNLAD